MIRSESSLHDKHSAVRDRRPSVGPDQVAEILSSQFQFRALEITELISFDSKNFAVRAERNVIEKQPDVAADDESDESNFYRTQLELVLKVLNLALCTPERLPITQKKFQCCQFLGQHGFLCPKTVYTSRGEMFSQIFETDSYAVLMTKLPGNILAADTQKITTVVLLEIGILLAEMHGALQNWDKDLLQCDPCNPWCLENLHLLSDYLYCIHDDHVCLVLSIIIEQFQQTRVNILPQIGKGIIHGDFHDWNLIVDWDSQSSLEASGLLSTSLPVNQPLPDSATWLPSSCQTHSSSLACKNMLGVDAVDNGSCSNNEFVTTATPVAVGGERGKTSHFCGTVTSGGYTDKNSTDANPDQSRYIENAFFVSGGVICMKTQATNPVNEQVTTAAITTLNTESIKQKYGIIDFEEVCLSYPVLELCRLIADLMIDCTAVDTLEIGGYIIAGYASVRRETVKEFRSALFSTVQACLAQYVILGTFEYQMQNESNDYCLEGSHGAKALLVKLNDMLSSDVLQVWANILKNCGLVDVL